MRSVSAGFAACLAATGLASPVVADPGDPIPGTGVFQVGTDIAPGLYYTNGPSNPRVLIFGNLIPESMCTSFTYSTPDANSDHVVNTNTSVGTTYVNIPATVAAFESKNCQPWTPA